MSVDLNWAALAPYVLIGGGLLAAGAGPAIKRAYVTVAAKVRQAKPQQPSSDAEPPNGFRAHVAIVLDSCPNAPYETRLSYLMDGLTEAQTLRREVDRLNNATTLNEAET